MVSIYFYSLMGGDFMHTCGNYQGTEECTHRFTYCNSHSGENSLDFVRLFNVKIFKVFTVFRELLHIFIKW